MIASVLQVLGLFGVIFGVYLLVGTGFAVITASIASIAVGYQLEARTSGGK